MNSQWQQQLKQAVSPLQEGVAKLRVNNFRPVDEGQLRPGKTAAVLVPIIDLPEPEVVLTRRALHLANHPGQVSFPGGAAEQSDDSAVSTALREAYEEIGLKPASVTPIGFLDRFDSISDYRVLPVVGLIKPPVNWVIDRSEVEEAFTIPLSVVLDPTRYKKREIKGDTRNYVLHSIDWQGHDIWGLTAAMLINLSWRMRRQSST
jgi:8-oxo-dGTP pyrophosphatase MutT (NUDIX family)